MSIFFAKRCKCWYWIDSSLFVRLQRLQRRWHINFGPLDQWPHLQKHPTCTGSRSGLDFINVLRTAFTPVVPQSVRTQSSHQYLFTLLEPTSVKAVRRTLMKLTPGCRSGSAGAPDSGCSRTYDWLSDVYPFFSCCFWYVFCNTAVWLNELTFDSHIIKMMIRQSSK